MSRKRILILLAAAAVLTATVLYAGWLRRDTALQGSGTVEARNIRVGSKIGGRIDKLLVREGDTVEAGQVLMTFDDKELLASLKQSRASAEKAKRGYRPEEIAEARAAAKQAKANWKVAVAQKENAQHKLDQLNRGYRPEEIASAEARYAQTQATLEKLQRGNRREDIDSAQAALAYDEARFRERQVVAPTAATVEVLDVRPGDLISPNTPVATLLERDQIYVRIYIPETEISRVRIGQKAQVSVDSVGRQVFDGVVEQINQQAEFLPRNVQTREERVHQVFGVKIRIDDASHRVLAGMAADVKLLGEK